ncbi:MAG: hypothetical protein ACXWLM_07090 [Myxococcales bacterium]
MPPVAFLSHGKMFLLAGDGPRPIESRFGEQIRDRAVRAVEKNAWKTEGFSARFQGRRPQVADPDLLVGPVLVTSIGQGSGPGRILYALRSGSVSGLFSTDGGGDEKRLFHGASESVSAPVAHPTADFIACAVHKKGGIANIAVMHGDGTDLAEVTEGDSLDGGPSWVPGQPSQLLYHSAGIGRDEAGRYAGLAPTTLHRIDFAKKQVEAVREEPGHDLLCPRAAADGSLWFIRRPWTYGARRIPLWRQLLGVALIPWNLLRAVWGFLSFFAIRYTGKPLLRAGTPDEEKQDMREMLILGNLIDASRDQQKAPEKPLVPASWELVRLRNGAAEVMAKSVLSYDLAADGTVVYTNGSHLEQIAPDGARTRLHADKRIQEVAILRG